MHWKTFLKETTVRLTNLEKMIPESYEGFQQMGRAAKKTGVLGEETKRFIALCSAISTRFTITRPTVSGEARG